METTVLDALQITKFNVNEQFGTAVKDLVAQELNEVLTENPKIAGLQDAIGTVLENQECVTKISNRKLVASPLIN